MSSFINSSSKSTSPNNSNQKDSLYVDSSDGRGRRRTRPEHITWDEETIAEHDKERGTRQKIDEPPTPYHYFDEEGNEVELSPSFESSSSQTKQHDQNFPINGTKDSTEKINEYSKDNMTEEVDKRDLNGGITPRNTLVDRQSTQKNLGRTEANKVDSSFQKQVLDQNNLNIFASKLQEVSNTGPSIAVKDEDGEEYIPPLRTQNEKKAFSSKRQQHYDEFLKMKEYKEKLAKGLLDEEDDEEES